jgi:hypothetical protein
MRRKGIFIGLAAGVVLFLQFSDCMALAAQQPKMMECCVQMKCPVAHMKADCCKAVVSAATPAALITGKAFVHAPALAAVLIALTPIPTQHRSVLPVVVLAQRRPPPDLYTLHHSFLI